MANRNFASGGKMYSMHVMPVLLDCNFVVAATDSAGLGITSLKGPGIANVYMKTSATKAAGSPGGTTGPGTGVIVIQLQDNYNRLFNINKSIISPLSGSSLLIASAGLTAGLSYTITIVGTTTAAAWHGLGVPAGITPAVGVSFIAAATSAVGTGAVQISASTGSAVASIEMIGNPNLLIAPLASANQGFGGEIILECRDYAGALVAPVAGSIISIQMYLSNSSVTVQGE